MLVAHREGELFRRASEGPDLVPLAPVNEIDLAAAWKLSKIIKQWQPAIVHAHDPHAVSMAALALVVRRARPAAEAGRVAPRRLPSAVARVLAVEVPAAGRVHRRIACHQGASSCRDGIPAARIEVVHDGIDVDKIQHRPVIDLHEEYWLPHGVPVIVNVGALVGHKGQKYLIDAMPLVLREVPDAHLIIFGEGELRAPLEKQIKQLSLAKRVLLPGFREDVMSLMKSADLFVMSSVTEGLGSAVLDAMAMGHAVVGTKAGGIPEAVVHDETGLLVEPADAKTLAAAIVAFVKGRGSAKAVRRSRPRAGR